MAVEGEAGRAEAQPSLRPTLGFQEGLLLSGGPALDHSASVREFSVVCLGGTPAGWGNLEGA